MHIHDFVYFIIAPRRPHTSQSITKRILSYACARIFEGLTQCAGSFVFLLFVFATNDKACTMLHCFVYVRYAPQFAGTLVPNSKQCLSANWIGTWTLQNQAISRVGLCGLIKRDAQQTKCLCYYSSIKVSTLSSLFYYHCYLDTSSMYLNFHSSRTVLKSDFKKR